MLMKNRVLEDKKVVMAMNSRTSRRNYLDQNIRIQIAFLKEVHRKRLLLKQRRSRKGGVVTRAEQRRRDVQESTRVQTRSSKNKGIKRQ